MKSKLSPLFILVAFFVIGSGNILYAFEVFYTTSGKVVKWENPQINYTISVNDAPLGGDVAILNSMSTWSSIIDNFKLNGVMSNEGCTDRNGKNEICFKNLGSSNIIAQNRLWYNSLTGSVTESDIVVNTYHSFATDGSLDKFDLQNIMTHELGHTAPLKDLYAPSDSEKTMYGYALKGEIKKRTLDQDDINGILFLYSEVESCSYIVSPTTVSYPTFLGGIKTFRVTASGKTCKWNVVNPSNSWITVLPLSRAGSSTGIIYVNTNKFLQSRTSTLVIAEKEVVIDQASASINLTTPVSDLFVGTTPIGKQIFKDLTLSGIGVLNSLSSTLTNRTDFYQVTRCFSNYRNNTFSCNVKVYLKSNIAGDKTSTLTLKLANLGGGSLDININLSGVVQ